MTTPLQHELQRLIDTNPTIFDVHYIDNVRRIARWSLDALKAAEAAIETVAIAKVDQEKRMTEADVDEAMRLADKYALVNYQDGVDRFPIHGNMSQVMRAKERSHLMQFVGSAKLDQEKRERVKELAEFLTKFCK